MCILRARRPRGPSCTIFWLSVAPADDGIIDQHNALLPSIIFLSVSELDAHVAVEERGR